MFFVISRRFSDGLLVVAALWKRFLDETGFKAFSEVMLEQEGAPQLGAANLFMSTGLGGLKPNTLVLTLPEQPADEESLSPAAKAYQRKLSVTSNSVYEAGAADGCRITCAYQNELWSTAASGDGTVETDGEDAIALRNTGTPCDIVVWCLLLALCCVAKVKLVSTCSLLLCSFSEHAGLRGHAPGRHLRAQALGVARFDDGAAKA